MVRCAVDNLIEVLNGGSSKHAVNPQALEHRALANHETAREFILFFGREMRQLAKQLAQQ
jgi:hypothetical protein